MFSLRSCYSFHLQLHLLLAEEYAHFFQDILMACPNVEKLTLGKCDNLDDELMFNILQSQSLQKCEELCLCDAPGLTQESVRTILMSLDK